MAVAAAGLTTAIACLIGTPVGVGDVSRGWELVGALVSLQRGVVFYDVVAVVIFCWVLLLLVDRFEMTIEATERWWYARGGGRPLPGRTVQPPVGGLSQGFIIGSMVLALFVFGGGTPVPYYYFAF